MFCCCYGVGTWAVLAAVRSCPLHCALGHRDAWLMARNQCAGHPQPQTEHLVLDLGDGIPALAPFPFWGRTNTKPKHCVLGMPGLAESGLSSYADSFHLAGAAVLSQWGFLLWLHRVPTLVSWTGFAHPWCCSVVNPLSLEKLMSRMNISPCVFLV